MLEGESITDTPMAPLNENLMAPGREVQKLSSMNSMVGVTGFEPATPTSRMLCSHRRVDAVLNSYCEIRFTPGSTWDLLLRTEIRGETDRPALGRRRVHKLMDG
jgi:hypothetical protein